MKGAARRNLPERGSERDDRPARTARIERLTEFRETARLADHQSTQAYDAWREHDLELTNGIIRQVTFQIVARTELRYANVNAVTGLVREGRDHGDEQIAFVRKVRIYRLLKAICVLQIHLFPSHAGAVISPVEEYSRAAASISENACRQCSSGGPASALAGSVDFVLRCAHSLETIKLLTDHTGPSSLV